MNFMASDELAAAARSACFTGLLLDAYEQTDRDGHYAPSPLPDRVYVVSQQTRLRPSGYVPLLVKVKLLDGRPKDVHFADDPGGISMTLAVAVEQGRPLDPAGVPTRVSYYQESKGNAPDLFSHADLPLTVSERLKQLIEEIEPGIHQFLPISFEDKKGAVTEERHLLVLGTVLDAGSPQHSTMLNGARWNNPGREQGAVLIDRAVVAGRHAWRDRRLPGALFVSDRIAGIIEERGWPHLRFGGYDLAG